MAKKTKEKFVPHEMIYREGDVGDCAYLIVRGGVSLFIVKDDIEVPLATLSEGDIFGDVSLVLGENRHTCARAIGETQVIYVNRELLNERIDDADPVVRLLLKSLHNRMSMPDNALGSLSLPVLLTNVFATDKQAAIKRMDLESRVAVALTNKEFVPFYQPIYDLKTCKIRGCEALLRWISSEGDVIPPLLFIEILEQSSLVLRAGRQVIEKCLEDLNHLQTVAEMPHDFFVSINVSGRQFSDPDFVEHLEFHRQRLNLNAKQIKLEVTERVMMVGPEALNTMNKCRLHGYQLAIDDFGTGFSSLQYLATMPLTDLKIDRSFVANMLSHRKSKSIIRSLIHMGHLLGLQVIAEGIETAEEFALLQKLGVEMGQGYMFCKPLPLAQFLKLNSQSVQKAAA